MAPVILRSQSNHATFPASFLRQMLELLEFRNCKLYDCTEFCRTPQTLQKSKFCNIIILNFEPSYFYFFFNCCRRFNKPSSVVVIVAVAAVLVCVVGSCWVIILNYILDNQISFFHVYANITYENIANQ